MSNAYQNLDMTKLANVPPQLKEGKRFVAWRETVNDKGEPTKPPINSHTGGNASTTNPATWGTWNEALQFYQDNRAKRPDLRGIGRTYNNAADGLMAVDLDHCLDDSGIIIADSVAAKWLPRLNSYTEVTPSNHGVRTWVAAKHDLGGKGTRKFITANGTVEFFCGERYATITGSRLPQFPAPIEDRQTEVDEFFQWCEKAKQNAKDAKKAKPATAATAKVASVSDAEVLERIQRASNCAAVMALWNGDSSSHANGDNEGRSEADAALCHHLWFFTGGNRDQVERMFGQSKLGDRDKWKDRPDYRERTLDFACNGEVWKSSGNAVTTGAVDLPPMAPTPSKPTPRTPPLTVSAAELMKMDLPPVKWIVKELIPEGLTFCCGKPKVGKSWLGLDMSLAICAGRLVLGRFPSTMGGVLYLALEDNLARIKERLQKLGTAAPDNLHFVTADKDFPRLNQGGLDHLESYVQQRPDLVAIVVDTLQRIKPIGARHRNAYETDTDALSPLQAFAMKHHLAVFVIHHLKKGTADDIFDLINGSVGLPGVADTNLVLRSVRRHEAVLHARGRAVEETDYAVSFEQCRWTVTGGATDIEMGATRRAITKVIRTAGKPLTPQEIANELKLLGHAMTKDNLWKTLGRMLEDSQVGRSDGKYELLYDEAPIAEESSQSGVSVQSGVSGQSGRKDDLLTDLTDLTASSKDSQAAKDDQEPWEPHHCHDCKEPAGRRLVSKGGKTSWWCEDCEP